MTSIIMPLMPRASRMLQWPVQRAAIPQGGANPKSRSQFGLGSATRPMKSESLVIADQQRCGEYVPGLVHTARHVTKSWQHPKPVAQPLWRELSKVGERLDEVVTR